MWICFTDTVQEPPPIQIGDDIIEGVKPLNSLVSLVPRQLKME